MANRSYESMSNAELLDEIRTFHRILGTTASLPEVAQDVQTFREEILVQQSQLLEAQRALEASRDRYADLFDFAPIGYATLDTAGVIREANLTVATMLGVERARLLGFPLLVHVLGEDRRGFLDHMSRCRASRDAVETRIRLRSKSGHVFPASLVSRATEHGTSGSMWNTAILDLSEQERAETERLRLAREEQSLREASEAKDRFLAVLSHELRTPLTPILFTLSALEQRGATAEELREAVAVLRRNVELEAKLIDDLLDTTRIARGKLHMDYAVVDVHGAIEEVLRMCREDAARAALTVRSELGASAHHVRGDATRLRQVLWNLVSNAIRYTPAGGTISLRTADERGGTLRITVEDNGSGIGPEMASRLFEPFEQGAQGNRRAGLGLGLAISKGIVEAHGGHIAAYSAGPDAGTRFEIELAAITAPATAAPERSDLPPPGEKARILLVEDHADTAQSLRELLELHGYQVLLAACVADALGHADDPFDVLVTDIGLPDGDGLQILRALREKRPVQGIALSGYGLKRDVAQSRAAGFACHLTKPVDITALIEAIDRLGARRAHAAGA